MVRGITSNQRGLKLLRDLSIMLIFLGKVTKTWAGLLTIPVGINRNMIGI